MEYEGKIIVIEGPDFSGKTTLIKNLVNFFLINEKIKPKVYRQPGATPLGIQCRNLLFNNAEVPEMDNLSERLLFAVDHVEFTNVLKKHREDKDALVICDRWSPMSNFVYGVEGRKLNYWEVLRLNDIINNDINPDLIIIIDMTLEECLKRYDKSKDREINKLDKQGVEFKQRIINGYMIVDESDLSMHERTKIIHINGVQTELKVLESAVKAINEFLV